MKKTVVLPVMILLVAAFVIAYTWMDADFNNDGKVNIQDQSIFSQFFGSTDCNLNNSWCNQTDIDEDGKVNLVDLSIFAGYYWCNENSTNESGCWE